MNNKWLHHVELVVYYAVVFVILREWLKPVIELTSTGYLTIFSTFIAIAFLLNILRVPIIVSWIVKLSYIAIILPYIYIGQSVFSAVGRQFLVADMGANIAVLFTGQFEQLTNPFRTFLFFVLLWMISYLMHYWLTSRLSIFSFFVLTIFFIATLDTFTEYDGTVAIVKVLVLGLLLTILLHVKRLAIEMGVVLSWRNYSKLFLPATIVIVGMSVVAVLLPKAEPQWPDPVPFLKDIVGLGGATSKAGLDEDDTTLGGSFEDDQTVVFEVHVKEPQYWRVETKDTYTTKGWDDSENTLFPLANYALPLSLPMGDFADLQQAYVYPRIERSYVLQTYGMYDVRTGTAGSTFSVNTVSERIVSRRDNKNIPLSNYEVDYSTPTFSFAALQQELDYEMPKDPRFLQIPEAMPDRVKTLAQQLTEGVATDYERAKAIEQYFQNNGYVYETQDVPVPEENEDYVDQFLFETKRGYCDNFSTSMVMLLRSVDIQARWVKGFAPGTEVGTTATGLKIFELTNNDAHSWVEAYIEGIGWMPFEPTVGFTNLTNIDYDVQTKEPEIEQQPIEETVEEAVEQKQTTEQQTSWLRIVSIAVLVLGFILAASVYVRKKGLIVRKQRKQPSNEFSRAYETLVKKLAKKGLVRQPNETLAVFAKRVDDVYGSDDMSKIVSVYEKILYSKDETCSFEEIKESWEYLINRTSS